MTVEWKPRLVSFQALLNGDVDNFFGPGPDPTSPVTQALPVTQVDAAAAENATLMVRMQGVTAGTHLVGVALNGAFLGTLAFADLASGVASFPVPAGGLSGGATLTLTAQGDATDVTLVDTVTLTYPRLYVADSDLLRCTAASGQPVVMTGFTSSKVRVVDITDPAQATALQGTVTPQGNERYMVTVVPQNGGTRTLLAFTSGQVRVPAGVTANQPSSWHAAQGGADLVIVSHGGFISSLAPLVAWRQAQGLAVAVVNVEDLYDEFTFGLPSPYAIRSLVASARTVWTRAPRWLLLVGDATVDPRNYFGMSQVNYVPVQHVWTSQLEVPSDDWFGDVNLDDVPEVPVGRLPVHEASDADALVAKILAYEQAGSAPWKNTALLVAGTNDSENDFESQLAAVQALLPAGVAVTTVRQGSTPGPAAAFLTAFNAGPGLVDYIGHGSTEVWPGDLFSSAVASTVANGPKTPFVISMTCLNGFFHDVWTLSLGEALMAAPGGGAVGVWASSGLTESASQATLNQPFIAAAYGGTPITVGEAVAAAKAAAADLDVRRSWILLGDPSMTLR